ncbi:MAG: FAD:protein FMN transferase [Bacteroidota bacterium]
MERYLLGFSLLLYSISIHAQRSRFHYQQPKIGTQVQLIFYAPDSLIANQLATQAFARIDSLNLVFSDYLPNSEISQLSATAGQDTCVRLSDEIWEVLHFSQQVSRQTNGHFDATIGSLSKLWRKMFYKQEFIGGVKLKHNKNLVNYNWLQLDKNEQCACLKKKGMRLDAGGLAKGYIVDEVFELFEAAGITQLLIDAGGDIRVGDSPPDSEGWKIERLFGISTLTNVAVATSGDTYRYLEWKGKRYSHIINPKTGYGVQNAPKVSVTATTAMCADAYASAFSVLAERKSRRLARRLGLGLEMK